MTQILLALIVLANLIVTFTKAFASANRISEVFDVEPEVESKGENVDTAASERPIIEFKNVSFAYENAGEDSIDNISFTINKGETLGIIGGTGSGKSTLAMLIPCFYRAKSGEVVVYGKDVCKYDPDSLRRTIGYVPQKAVLFSGTVRENMQLRKKDASDEEIIAALKTAQAWEFVSKLTNGLDTAISQGGKNLSGGILILDDSSSALDYATDLALRRAIASDMPDMTVIMISQRTTSLMDADKIVVMEDGQAVGIGTHAELLENCEVYSEIYRSQMNEKEDGANA